MNAVPFMKHRRSQIAGWHGTRFHDAALLWVMSAKTAVQKNAPFSVHLCQSAVVNFAANISAETSSGYDRR